MDSDKEFKIKITTAADMSGLKQVSDALEDISDAAQPDLTLAGENSPPSAPPGLNGTSAGNKTPGGEFPAAAAGLPPALRSLADAARLLLAAVETLNGQLPKSTAPTPDRPENAPSSGSGAAVPSVSADPTTGGASVRASRASDEPDASGPGGDPLPFGTNVRTDQSTLLNSLANLLQSTSGSMRDLLGLVRQGQQDQAALRNEIETLKRSVANLSTSRSNPGLPTPP